MTAERLHNGAWQVSAMVEDRNGAYMFTRTFYGYTKREAVAQFRQECERCNANILGYQQLSNTLLALSSTMREYARSVARGN